MKKQIVIIGGGASGLMAGITAAKKGAVVTILEAADKPGKKLLATGNGRCNFTNVLQDKSCYRGSANDLAMNVVNQFSVSDTLMFFSKLGIYSKNRNGWMYPTSDEARAVLDVLLMEACNLKIKIKTRERVQDVRRKNQRWKVKTSTWEYPADSVIITSGSPAGTDEKTDPFVIQIAKKLDIETIPLLPALTALMGKDTRFSSWAGVRIQGKATLILNSIPMKSEAGEIQLTSYGISGIPVFQLSRYAIRAVFEGCSVLIELDFIPELSEDQLYLNLKMREENCPYKTLQERFVGLLPSKLIPVVAPPETELSEIVRNCKHFPVAVQGAVSMKQAQVCSGGILLRELDAHLQSRKYPGLYFAGEGLDVDGACGGYNLQWAWSSGSVAGSDAARGES